MTDNKYRRGKIYKIISYQTDAVYYGSTIEENLTNRLAGHRRKYKKWLNGTYCYVALLEEYKCICGASIHPACQSDKQTHFNSKKHIKYIDENHAIDETSKT